MTPGNTNTQLDFEPVMQELRKFYAQQNSQKQRGLNNFNIFVSLRKQSDEVHVHSRFLFEMLNPNGSHYQGSLFLEKFMATIGISDFNFQAAIVRREVTRIRSKDSWSKKKRDSIDLYITDSSKHIVIENKIRAPDQPKQLSRYIDFIVDENPEINKNSDLYVFYLTKSDKLPSEDSHSGYGLELVGANRFLRDGGGKNRIPFVAINYEDHILNWIFECQKEIANITNLSVIFDQYRDVVLRITEQYKGAVIDMKGYFYDTNHNSDHMSMLFKLVHGFPIMRSQIMTEFFSQLEESLGEKFGETYEVYFHPEKDLSKKYQGAPVRIRSNPEDPLQFGFEFDKNDYLNPKIGVIKDNKDIVIDNYFRYFQDARLKSNYFSKSANTGWWAAKYTAADSLFETVACKGPQESIEWLVTEFCELIGAYSECLKAANKAFEKESMPAG